jgi:predicted RNase H-like nuclease (RuvC/YqgF family)
MSTSASEQTVEQLLDSCNSIIALLNESQIPMTNTESTITTDSVNTFEQREKKIHKLERRLNSLSKTISKLEEKDMSLDEMEHCDLYHVESNLKKQAYEVS